MFYKSGLVSLSHVPIGLGFLLLQLPHPNHLTPNFRKNTAITKPSRCLMLSAQAFSPQRCANAEVIFVAGRGVAVPRRTSQLLT